MYCVTQIRLVCGKRNKPGATHRFIASQIKVTCINRGAADTEFSLVRFKGDEQKAKAVYEGFEPLQAADIANALYYCATLPEHVCINDLVITSTAQANSFYTYKEQ